MGESGWANTIFDPTAGRKIPGMNAGLAIEYGNFSTENACKVIGVEYFGERQTRHPIPWIDKYLNLSSKQVAPQETTIKAYRVGQVTRSSDDDLSSLGEEFSF